MSALDAVQELIKRLDDHSAEAELQMNEVISECQLLHQRLEAKEIELEKERIEKAARAERVKALESELQKVSASLIKMNEVIAECQLLHQRLEAKEIELEKERIEKAARAERIKALESDLQKVSASLIKKNAEAEAESNEAELNLSQLYQVQEELEHYFYKLRSKDALIQKHQAQQQRIKKLMRNLLIEKENTSTESLVPNI